MTKRGQKLAYSVPRLAATASTLDAPAWETVKRGLPVARSYTATWSGSVLSGTTTASSVTVT